MSASRIITPVRTYVTVFVAAALFTVSHGAGGRPRLRLLNTPIALGIAVAKAWLVVWFFMGVRYNTPLTKVVVVAGFLWLLILFGIEHERLPDPRLARRAGGR